MITLETSLASIHGTGPRFIARLKNLGIETVRDLLWHFPSRYEDFSQIYKIAELEPGQQATVQGKIESVEARRSWRRKIAITEAILADDSGSIRAVWFNQPYVRNILRPGKIANFSGKVALSEEGEPYLSHPIHELVYPRREVGAPTGASEETKHTARLVPIYPETKGLTSKGLRFLIQPILKSIAKIKEWIPEEVLVRYGLPEVNTALRHVHFPDVIEEALIAKKRFAFEDLFALQLMNLSQKLKLAREKGPAMKTDVEELKKIIGGLPFSLTVSQKKSLWEILQDMEKSRPMNRLLQGDVGSGKTVVAALSTLIAAKNNYQTAFMAPTEVLSRQHFETLKKFFRGIARDYQPTMGLITSSGAKIIYENDLESELKKSDFSLLVKSGEINIAIGTHALLQTSVSFKNLGLVIVDEQHRFGVEQRAGLSRVSTLTPHFLSMSATPIPRTLMLTIFGDLDISVIDELPSDRKQIATKVVAPEDRERAYRFIRNEIKKGRQAFVICPRIEPDNLEGRLAYPEMQKLELKSVKEEYEKLSKKVFPDLRVSMLHGQMPSRGGSASGGKPSKEAVMNAFRSGEIDVLVSTSVIEVGVDVPNASIMMIEGSDRFGLAQLYQFRGRVGRGAHQSYCLLFTDSNGKSVSDRLRAIVEAKNGFELAEKDLHIRGPGEFIGERQSGLPDIAMRALQDVELIKASRAAAVQIIHADPSLKKYPALKSKLAEFQERIHLE